MVAAVRRGWSLREVAHRFRVGASTVYRWTQRAGQERLDRVDWTNRPSRAQHTGRTDPRLEDWVLRLRQQLQASDLGQCGARAIHQALQEQGWTSIPCVRTLGRILARRGALEGRRRLRHSAPPRGWYLPEVAAGRAELDSFDIVEGLVIEGGPDVEVLNGISLHGGLAVSHPVEGGVTAKIAVEVLIGH